MNIKKASITVYIIIIAIIIVTGYVIMLRHDPDYPKTITIGIPAPLTGVRADAGEFTKNGISIAEEEINSNTKNKYKINFLYEDTRYEPQVAVSAVRKFIDLDKIHYIIGPYNSSEVLAVAPIAEQSKTIMISHSAQTDEISQAGDYVFRIIHNVAQEAPVSARFVAKHMQGGVIHFLAINTAISDPYINRFRSVFESSGKTIGSIEKFDSKATDFKTELLKLKAQKPTSIFTIAGNKQIGLILKQARELGIDAQFYNLGTEGPEIVKNAGKYAEGLLYPYSYDNHDESPAVKRFYSKYVERFSTEPDTVAANAYDAAYLLSGCVEAEGDDVDAVKQCLYETKGFKGASGTFDIDENGDAIKQIFFKTVKDGKFMRYDG